jgi:diketogulonate reductase-like aldo/keto reductase
LSASTYEGSALAYAAPDLLSKSLLAQIKRIGDNLAEYVNIGYGDSKAKITAIGLGTWKIPNDSESGIAAIRHGISLGINFVDTAEMYGNEELVGKAIKGLENVFLATKVSPSHFRYEDLIKACESSLKRLAKKSIWLYQLHWPNNRVPIEETMHAMERLLDEGKIMNIGVSNFSVEEMVRAQQALDHSKIASNQVEYSISVRDPESELLEFCKKEGIALIAYSPLARGAIFNDKSIMQALSDTGKKYSKPASEVALRYVLQKGKGTVVAIPKASSPKHIEENADAMSWSLSDEDMKYLESLKGLSRPPLAGKMLKAFLKNTTLWAKLMEQNEKRRREHHQ